MRATRKAQCQAGRYQHHHHVERRHTLRDQRLPFLSAQDAINLASMAFACCGITQHDRVAQHFFQRNSFVSQHGMTRGHGYHQLVFPNWIDDDAVAGLIGHGKARVVQIIMQALDLLIQRHFEEPDFDFWIFFAATCQ
ncbi:hypothetical protein Q5W_14710 [Hydrogenophaga sp. PBC]|nr:hypothetical protein Q5W_14710 [Hydrogenophaga sp. PBC]